MNSIKYQLSIFILLAVAFNTKAQQSALFNTYSYDLMQLNIAAVGRTCFEANVNYRSQWAGIKETPKLYQLNAGLALGKSNGIGIKVAQQSMGLLKVTNATFGYAYRVKLSETSKLHLGLGVAWQQNQFTANNAIVLDNNDASLGTNQAQQRNNNFDTEAGALFLGSKLTLGVSAIHLYNSNNTSNVVGYKTNPQINTVLAYKFNKGKSVEIEPWIVNRYTVNGVNQPEGILNFKFKQMVTIGAGYRLNYGYLALAGFEIGKFKVAYSFDYGSGSNAKNLGSSHQILLGFDMCRKKAEEVKKPEEPKVTLYFINENGTNKGPYKMEQLQAMVKEGSIKRNTPITDNKTNTPVVAENITELTPLFPPKEAQYIVMVDGKEGSYTMNQLKDMVKSGKIQRETPIRNEKESASVIAENMADLAPLFPPKQPEYFVTIDGVEKGSYIMSQLQQMTKDGTIKRKTAIRKKGETVTTSAENIKELEPYFPVVEKVKFITNINYLAKGLIFANGKTTLTPDKKALLDEIANEFKTHAKLKVYIEGFASKTGDPKINKILSQKRAEHVRQELIKRGVNAASILGSKAYGSEKAIEGADEANRSVKFEIIE